MGIPMDMVLVAVVGVVLLALLFDFTNGFHDAANSTSTVVATRAMKPRHAVYMAAFFNFAALFVVGTAVANTVAKTVDVEALGVQSGGVPMGLGVAFGALLGAIFWNYFTWSIGMPSSSSHALIGGLLGAGLSAGGLDVIKWSSIEKAALAIVISPLVAFTVAFLAMFLVGLLQRMTHWEDDAKPFKWLQIVSAAAVSFGHGANDAQKTMGVIAFALVSGGYITADSGIPVWVEIAAYSMIALGTMWGGWTIIETMGLRITKLNANSGVAANIGAVTSIFGATELGVPISTTQAAAASVMGSGAAAGTGLNGRKIGEMVIAWTFTLPAAAVVGFVAFKLTTFPDPWGWVASLSAIAVLGIWAGRLMMHAENADDIEQMLPSEAELHQYHTVPHPDLHPYEGPPHVNHHELEEHPNRTPGSPQDTTGSPLP
ncbi:MAG TPA: inorganic phosphate transporter [Candidatus Limnocylindrales bacterium]|nr:inorganic phosphate transporter [Candidatus Limnocylindrales bacterium]